MNTINISTKEIELIQEINNDANLLESALKYVRKLKKAKAQTPCQYSVEELKSRLAKGREEAKNAGGTNHEEFMKEVETWF